jgi:hypothetical protein
MCMNIRRPFKERPWALSLTCIWCFRLFLSCGLRAVFLYGPLSSPHHEPNCSVHKILHGNWIGALWFNLLPVTSWGLFVWSTIVTFFLIITVQLILPQKSNSFSYLQAHSLYAPSNFLIISVKLLLPPLSDLSILSFFQWPWSKICHVTFKSVWYPKKYF